MTVSGIGAASPLPILTNTPAATSDTGGGESFGNMIGNALNNVNNLQNKSDDLAVKAATGDLTDVHDYTIAATEASLATELTVAVRNKALEAFNDIMRMPI